MSDNLCEAPMKRSIRDTRRIYPRRSAYLRQIWLNRSGVRLNPCLNPHYISSISKRRYGVQMEGNPHGVHLGMKSSILLCKCLLLSEYKLSTSIEGVRNEKTRDQIHKDSCPELGCSGNLSLVVTVHPVNVGTSCFGRKRMERECGTGKKKDIRRPGNERHLCLPIEVLGDEEHQTAGDYTGDDLTPNRHYKQQNCLHDKPFYSLL